MDVVVQSLFLVVTRPRGELDGLRRALEVYSEAHAIEPARLDSLVRLIVLRGPRNRLCLLSLYVPKAELLALALRVARPVPLRALDFRNQLGFVLFVCGVVVYLYASLDVARPLVLAPVSAELARLLWLERLDVGITLHVVIIRGRIVERQLTRE